MAVVLVGTSVLADVSKPGAPSFGTSNDAINSSPSDAYKKSGYVTKKPNLPTLPQLQPQISSLLCADAQTDCKATIETVCAAVICELQRQSLTTGAWDYLEPHAFAIAEGITDQKLRTMHIMP